MARFQFSLRTLLWVTLSVAVIMVPVSAAVQFYLDLKHIYTVELDRLKPEGKPLPGEPGYKRHPNPYRNDEAKP